LRLSESKENVFSLPNVSKMPKRNGTQRKATDVPAWLKIVLTKILGGDGVLWLLSVAEDRK